MNGRSDEAYLWGLAHNPDMQRRMTCNALTVREHSTLYGMLKQWPYVERRHGAGKWDGTERRASRMLVAR